MEFKIGDYTVEVGPHVVSATRFDGVFHNANVDYYYDEDRGYGCKTEKEVAVLFEKHCNEWDHPRKERKDNHPSDWD